MIKWKCGKCGKEYTLEELDMLRKIPLVPEDTDPIKQHGFTPVCDCGYVFHRDKWHLVDKVKLKECTVEVSTVFLEINHGHGGQDLWYETMVFPAQNSDVDIECYFCERYETKEEAIEGHKKAVKLLKEGKYEIVPTKFELRIQGDEK